MKDEGGQAFIHLTGWHFFFRGYILWGFDFYSMICSTVFVYPINWYTPLITLIPINMWQNLSLAQYLSRASIMSRISLLLT